jgi:hypothetical protein
MRWSSIVLVAACAAWGPARAQQPPMPNDTGAAFLERVRAATDRYRDRDRAMLDGYRPIGDDFPGMGEHWLQIGVLFSARFTVEEPPVLEYATIDGRPTLVGVAYALPLLAGEQAPAFPSADAWHEHVGTVQEETDLLRQMMMTHATMAAPRLAMLHVWAWVPNPAGAFRSDNWALPFVRAGLAAPVEDPGAVAGRVVSLVSGGDAFYVRVFENLSGATRSDSVAIVNAMAGARAAAAAWVSAHHGRAANSEDLGYLRGIWAEMWRTFDATLTSGASGRLASVRGR